MWSEGFCHKILPLKGLEALAALLTDIMNAAFCHTLASFANKKLLRRDVVGRKGEAQPEKCFDRVGLGNVFASLSLSWTPL